MQSTHLFPFYGAGHAQYYEWAEVTIRFIKNPSTTDIENIIKLAPSLIKLEEDDFSGRILLARSSESINEDIEKAYNKNQLRKAFSADGRSVKPSVDTLRQFNEDIEKWLLEIHTLCPIQFAYRTEDEEVVGTQFSDWHTESLKYTRDLLEKISKDNYTFKQNEDEKESFRFAISGIIDYAEIDEEEVSQELINYIFPAYRVEYLFEKGKIKDIIDIIREINTYEDSIFAEEVTDCILNLEIDNKKTRALFLELGKEILKSKDIFLREYGDVIARIAKEAIIQDDQKLIRLLKKQLSYNDLSCLYITSIAYEAYGDNESGLTTIVEKGKNDVNLSIQLFDLALSIEIEDINSDLDLDIYYNALWILDSDNNKCLPINKKLNYKFLEKCMPFGPKNPAIYFNALCLYVEMNDLDQAFTCLKFVKKYEFEFINEGEYDMLIKQLKTEKLFIKLRHDVRYKEIEKTL